MCCDVPPNRCRLVNKSSASLALLSRTERRRVRDHRGQRCRDAPQHAAAPVPARERGVCVPRLAFWPRASTRSRSSWLAVLRRVANACSGS